MTDSTPAPPRPPATRRPRGIADGILRRTRRLRVVVIISVYLLVAPLAFGFVWLIYAVSTRDRVRRARRMQRVAATGFRIMHAVLRWLAILRFDHREAFASVPRGPCVVVANHPTRMDISSITAVLGGGCTIVKPLFFRRRWLRALMLGCWHVEGPGDDPTAAGRVVDEAVERLRQGLIVIIFPEGTRSPATGMLPFGRTAFEIACRARVPVVSVAVRCDPPWMTKQRGLFDPPHPVPWVRLERLATDDPAGVDFESRALRQRVEARFRHWIEATQLPEDAAPLADVNP